MNDNKNDNKIERTPQIIERLRTLQAKHGYSDSAIANTIDIPLTTYKNIIRAPKDNTFIKFKYIERLADFYECTTDYLICKSQHPSDDRTGQVIIRPLSFKKDKMLEELFHHLRNDDKTLQSLYFIICKLPYTHRNNILTSLNSIASLLKTMSFYDRDDELNSRKFETIVKCLELNDTKYSDAMVKLAEADGYFKENLYSKAIPKYLGVIYSAIDSTRNWSLANEACIKILSLAKEWSGFPPELQPLASALPKLKEKKYQDTPPHIAELIWNHSDLA